MKLLLKSVAFGIGLTAILSAATYVCMLIAELMGSWGTWYPLCFFSILLSIVFAVAYYCGSK